MKLFKSSCLTAKVCLHFHTNTTIPDNSYNPDPYRLEALSVFNLEKGI